VVHKIKRQRKNKILAWEQYGEGRKNNLWWESCGLNVGLVHYLFRFAMGSYVSSFTWVFKRSLVLLSVGLLLLSYGWSDISIFFIVFLLYCMYVYIFIYIYIYVCISVEFTLYKYINIF